VIEITGVEKHLLELDTSKIKCIQRMYTREGRKVKTKQKGLRIRYNSSVRQSVVIVIPLGLIQSLTAHTLTCTMHLV
jgi:hypothetical protein